MQHTIWSMYSAIRNGSIARRKSILHTQNTLCIRILTILYKEGYIYGFRINPKNSRQVEIFLKYNDGKPALNKINALSKPGRRVYLPLKTLWGLKTSLSTLVLSTPVGLLSDKECRKFFVGGEVLCIIS